MTENEIKQTRNWRVVGRDEVLNVIEKVAETAEIENGGFFRKSMVARVLAKHYISISPEDLTNIMDSNYVRKDTVPDEFRRGNSVGYYKARRPEDEIKVNPLLGLSEEFPETPTGDFASTIDGRRLPPTGGKIQREKGSE